MNTINTNSGDSARSPFFVLNFNCYNVTPFLNMAISLYPFISFFTFSPFAVAIILSMKSFRRVSMSTPSTSFPALKSIQFCFDLKSCELVLIFIVGTKVPNGVPRPVVNKTIWQPEAANAVDATKSFPGAESRLRPLVFNRSAYSSTPLTGACPHFCVQPKALSSSVDIPPALFPGEGFSPTGSP